MMASSPGRRGMGRSNVSDSVAALFVWLATFGKRCISTRNIMLTSTGVVVNSFSSVS